MASARIFVKSIKVIALKLLTVFLSLILVFIIVPIFCILITPLYLFRWIVFKSSKLLRPDLSKMMSTRGSPFAAEAIYTKPEMVLVIALQVEGTPSVELLRSKIKQTALNAKCPKTGNQLFPELQQNIFKWLGYPFLKPIQSFKIEDHVNYYNNPAGNFPLHYTGLKEILKTLSSKPWSTKRALWECLVMRNYIPKSGQTSSMGHSVIIFRIHHALADGYSILNLMARVSELGTEFIEKLPQPHSLEGSSWRKMISAGTFLMKAPYELSSTVLMLADKNAWKLPERVLRSGTTYGASSDAIPLEYLKQIKKSYSVSFTALLLAMITGGVREMMSKKSRDLPEKVRIVFPLPLAGHPDKLRNYMSGGIMSLPIGESNSIKRIQVIHRKFEKLRRSTIPVTLSHLAVITGGLPLCCGKTTRKMHTTLMLTNMPGPPDRAHFLDHPVEEVYFTGGLIPGTVAVTFGFNTYDGKARFVGGGFDTILSSQSHADELIRLCVRELDILKQAGMV